jgi:hypothetical protein
MAKWPSSPDREDPVDGLDKPRYQYDAATFERWNIVNRVIPDEAFESETRSFVERLAARSDARVCRRQENCCAHIWKAAPARRTGSSTAASICRCSGNFVRTPRTKTCSSLQRSLTPSGISRTHQDRSAWTHELDVRPFKEKF